MTFLQIWMRDMYHEDNVYDVDKEFQNGKSPGMHKEESQDKDVKILYSLVKKSMKIENRIAKTI